MAILPKRWQAALVVASFIGAFGLCGRVQPVKAEPAKLPNCITCQCKMIHSYYVLPAQGQNPATKVYAFYEVDPQDPNQLIQSSNAHGTDCTKVGESNPGWTLHTTDCPTTWSNGCVRPTTLPAIYRLLLDGGPVCSQAQHATVDLSIEGTEPPIPEKPAQPPNWPPRECTMTD